MNGIFKIDYNLLLPDVPQMLRLAKILILI